MGGFNKEQFAQKFDVSERYFPIVLIALGKASVPAFNTTSLPLDDVLIEFISWEDKGTYIFAKKPYIYRKNGQDF